MRSPSSSASAASTTSSCVFGETFGKTFAIFPSPSMMKVERWTPMYFFPYIDFSTQTPYFSATEWSSSASRVKSSDCLSANFRIAGTVSGETPITRTPAAS